MRCVVAFMAGIGAAAVAIHAHMAGWDRTVMGWARTFGKSPRRRTVRGPAVPSDRFTEREARDALGTLRTKRETA